MLDRIGRNATKNFTLPVRVEAEGRTFEAAAVSAQATARAEVYRPQHTVRVFARGTEVRAPTV